MGSTTSMKEFDRSVYNVDPTVKLNEFRISKKENIQKYYNAITHSESNAEKEDSLSFVHLTLKNIFGWSIPYLELVVHGPNSVVMYA